VRYHLKEHLPKLLALARDAERAARADSLLDRIEGLQERTEAALTKAEEGENPFATFRGIAEMRRNLELIGEITKELNRTPTLNLSMNPEWLQLEAAIHLTLEDHPAAKRAVVSALKELPSGTTTRH